MLAQNWANSIFKKILLRICPTWVVSVERCDDNQNRYDTHEPHFFNGNQLLSQKDLKLLEYHNVRRFDLSAIGFSQIEKYREQLDSKPKPDGLTPQQWEERKQKSLFAFVDDLLDHESAVRHLEDGAQAEIVQNAFLHFANERYKLLAFVVMPSHHHWLFLPDEAWAIEAVRRSRDSSSHKKTPREIISHSIQSYTATMCNRVRNATGAYWQHETFDHRARDEAETLRIIEYIEQNPVKAGLVSSAAGYRFSSARIRKQLALSPGQAITKVG